MAQTNWQYVAHASLWSPREQLFLQRLPNTLCLSDIYGMLSIELVEDIMSISQSIILENQTHSVNVSIYDFA